MPSMVAVFFTLVAVCALLLAERAGSRAGVWLAKPAASLGFVVAAWFAPARPTFAGQGVLVALALSAVGDVLLIPPGNGRAFLLGIVSFAGGHLAYAVAFAAEGLSAWAFGLGLVGMGLVAALTLRWLAPHLPHALRAPVHVYVLVITVMVASALGFGAATGDLRVVVGALAFAASDLSVARERFVRPGFVNLAWGLPLYYGAQLLFAWSSAG